MNETGPEYPPGPQPGSNGIGLFAIGISQIGSIPNFDVYSTVISQYANSEILTRLILNIDAYLDQTQNLDAFFDNIWNVATARGKGLDIWGEIVGVNRVLQVATGQWFGFDESLPGAFTFGQAAFYSGAPLTDSYALSDQTYRQLIMTKAAANITNGSIPAINRILMSLFPNRGNAWVTEGYHSQTWFGFMEAINLQGFNQAPFYSGAPVPSMTMTYTFAFPLSPVELAIVGQSGVLPKSTGVAATVVTM